MTALLIAKNATTELFLRPEMANRHGLITGATGTGKTVTLQRLAEGFSHIGVPVFMADVKGDLSGMAKAGGGNSKVQARIEELKLGDFPFTACPVAFWDVWGQAGHPARTTVSELGPALLSRLLNLNDTQTGVLNLVFKIADDAGLLLLDLKDLRAILQHVGDNAKSFTTEYGNVSAASIGAIQRGLLTLEQEGAESLFGEPALNIDDLMQTDPQGRGVVNLLAADKLLHSPRMYATFLLWLLAELFERMPEAGDLPKPKLVFFFDEAHLLFKEAPPALLEKIEQVVRLIRSKGVGVYFVTQNPSDIAPAVLSQLGNRVQHALRAFTPADRKAVKAAAVSLRDNESLDEQAVLEELGVGEALVSLLDEKGQPGVVERAFVVPPGSHIGPVEAAERASMIQSSVLYGHYEAAVDRESAYEILKARAAEAVGDGAEDERGSSKSGDAGDNGLMDVLGDVLIGDKRRQGVAVALAKSAARAIGSELGHQVIRGVLGSLLGGSGGRKRR